VFDCECQSCDDCDCPSTSLIICKGDDIDFSRNNPIYLRILSKVDLTGLKLHFHFFDYCKIVDEIPSDGKIPMVFTADDTSEFPLGKNYASVWLEDETGKRRSVTKKIIIDVTTDPEVAYPTVVVVL